MARETLYTTEICPNCGTTAKVTYSENDYPFMKRLARSISNVEGDLSVEIGENDMFKITCKQCGHSFDS